MGIQITYKQGKKTHKEAYVYIADVRELMLNLYSEDEPEYGEPQDVMEICVWIYKSKDHRENDYEPLEKKSYKLKEEIAPNRASVYAYLKELPEYQDAEDK